MCDKIRRKIYGFILFYCKFWYIMHAKKNNQKKRKMSYEIIDTIQITGLCYFDNYQKLNSVEISIDSNKLNYKKKLIILKKIKL